MTRIVLAIGVLLTTWVAGAELARAQDAGTGGGVCYGNGTCNSGLTCDAGTCVAPQTGTPGGACYGNSTCNAGLSCSGATQTCVAPAATAPKLTLIPAATTPASGAIDSMPTAAPAPAVSASVAPPAVTARRWRAGAKAGFLLSGEVDVDDSTYSSDSGLLVNLGIDWALGPRLYLGGFAIYGSTGLEGEVDAYVLTVGGTLKGRIPAGRVEVRPGVAIGHQTIGGEAFDDSGDSTGVDIGGLVELAVPMSPTADFLGEIGFMTQPSGGNENVDITFGPIFYIAGGASFGG